jgi:hypothetical protein
MLGTVWRWGSTAGQRAILPSVMAFTSRWRAWRLDNPAARCYNYLAGRRGCTPESVRADRPGRCFCPIASYGPQERGWCVPWSSGPRAAPAR